ncbi:MAG: diguanylate cyclase, partial [Pseudomonadota bacterium]|nr:diguanylate cyclase [Pseudomonadota bacterium]
MKPKDDTASASSANPAEVAREAFRQLAIRRIAPTPDAYRDIYDEIAGTHSDGKSAGGPEQVLREFVAALQDGSSHGAALADLCARLDGARESRNWPLVSKTLTELIASLRTSAPETAQPSAAPQSAPLPIVAPNPASVPTLPSNVHAPDIMHRPMLGEDTQARTLRELLARTLVVAVTALLNTKPELAAEAEALGRAVREADSDDALQAVSASLRQLCFRIEMRAGDVAEEQELLLRLFRLLLDNISELTEEDSWLHGQIEGVQKLLAGPIDHHALLDATRALKDVIYKQGTLKHSLTDAKVTVKNMMITFIDRLGALATSTGDYHQQIDLYSRKITQAPDIGALNKILDDVMRDTRQTQSQALRSRDEMLVAKQTVQDADQRIQQLEDQLRALSELVREDQLTGSLNRRGLDDVLEREIARADRRHSPLCVAMLDLDDFKRLNDTHGHLAGDEALIHLVRVIKDTLRSMDVIARFGGEEFLIVLPDTAVEAAMQTVTRLQRELTKRIFMHNNERLLITFSPGVATRSDGEAPIALIK